MFRKITPALLFAACLCFCLMQGCDPATQQTTIRSTHTDSGTLVVTLGKDTTIIQHYSISGDSIRTKIITIPEGIYIIDAAGVLYADGTIKELSSKSYKLNASGGLDPDWETKITTTDDSTFIEVKDDSTATGRFGGHCILTNDADISAFYVFPFRGFYAPRTVGDSAVGNQFVFGHSRRYSVKRATEQSLRIGSNIMGYLTLELDKDNKLQAINGVGSSLNIMGVVNRQTGFDSLQQAAIHVQLQNGPKPGLITRDTATFSKNGLNVAVNYWRPSVRGRKIFGAVVPYNRFWRTGANDATVISFDKPVLVNGQRLDAGRYSIFTLPTANEWTIMFNKEADIWGTDYDSTMDVLRVPMKVGSIPALVEQLTITLQPSGDGGMLVIEWEKTKASVPFKLL